MSQLRLIGLRKSFVERGESVSAVSDLSLTVDDGELVVLVGPSGCGKTTVLRLMAGLETLDAGAIHMGDREVTSCPPKDRNLAMVFQDYALYTHLSVYENLAFPLKMRRLPQAEIRERVGQMAERLGVAPLLDRRSDALSGGEQQRVALGRALVRRPDAVLLDEPLSSLDASLRLRMRSEIKSFQQAWRTTMVYVTHDQEEAMSLAHRLGVMRDGTLLQWGTPEEVYRRPSCRFVASFLGTPSMNLWRGQVKPDGTSYLFQCEVGCFEIDRDLGRQAGETEAVVGVRPDRLRLESAEQRGESVSADGRLRTDTMTVCAVDSLGDRQHVTLAGGGGVYVRIAAAPSDAVGRGDRVRCSFATEDVHLFHGGECGERIG